MIIVAGTARFAEGEIARLKAPMEENIAASRAEPGCDHYAYAVDLSDPNLLHIAEIWRDQAALDAHMETPHIARFMAALGEAKVEALSVRTYRADYLETLLGE